MPPAADLEPAAFRRFHPLVALATLLAGLVPAAAAELTFSQPTATFTAPITADGQDVVFAFRNDTGEALTVTDIHTGCGCVTGELEKRVYAPGESGQLQVHVDFQNRTGGIRKVMRIKVRGAPGTAETEQRLKIDGVALTPLVMSDLTVSWALGEAPSTKEITITVKDGERVSDLAIEEPALNGRFTVELVPAPGGGGTLRLTPVHAGQATIALIAANEVQQAYLLSFRHLPTGVVKKERFYALIYR